MIFPEEVLRAYFKAEAANKGSDARKGDNQTFYEILAESRTANFDQIRSAYRRLARIWHPDVNHEEDAPERFRALKRAYDVLGDPDTRRQYDAGLALEASLGVTRRVDDFIPSSNFYRAPLTCGEVRLKGVTKLGRIHVESIDAWHDVVNRQGKTMVSSWDRTAEPPTFKVEWVADFQVEV